MLGQISSTNNIYKAMFNNPNGHNKFRKTNSNFLCKSPSFWGNPRNCQIYYGLVTSPASNSLELSRESCVVRLYMFDLKAVRLTLSNSNVSFVCKWPIILCVFVRGHQHPMDSKSGGFGYPPPSSLAIMHQNPSHKPQRENPTKKKHRRCFFVFMLELIILKSPEYGGSPKKCDGMAQSHQTTNGT